MPYRDTKSAAYKAMKKQNAARHQIRVEKWLSDHKSANPCKCGETDPCVMEFHHRDISTKKFNLGNRGGARLGQVMAEVAKCECMCANCHRKGHAGRPHPGHVDCFKEGVLWHDQ